MQNQFQVMTHVETVIFHHDPELNVLHRVKLQVIEVFCVSKFIASYEISLEYVQSGMVLLIRRLTHGLYLDSSREDEDLLIIDLVERYHLACSLMGTGGSLQFQNPGLNEHIETNSWVYCVFKLFTS
ncbi:uncharacterized protein LOC124942355 isoform X2 [Impatiens glandulifera]|uniref:uncharacterized protein LOC124942355 isoform X2 n=1 Tax=Impatiens glandulifera TaxID=253017 RepID=UPI001FB0A0FE|nr:uncharacterized protein LOC124942355 isoform X2 [Impatiens glandulifera]